MADTHARHALDSSARPAVSDPASRRALPGPVLWGIVVGVLQAATPLVFWWLDSATVYALGLAVIAAVYIGFAVADGRPKVIAIESSVAFAFVLVAASAITARWWPPVCMVVDWVVAAIVAVEIAAGARFG